MLVMLVLLVVRMLLLETVVVVASNGGGDVLVWLFLTVVVVRHRPAAGLAPIFLKGGLNTLDDAVVRSKASATATTATSRKEHLTR